MRTIATICFVFVLAVSMGVLSVKAQDANTTLPPSFFHDESNERLESIEAELLNIQKDLVQLALVIESLNEQKCECQCDCGKAKAAPTGKITMVSMNGCEWCPIADAYHGPRYKASGWQWSTRSDGNGRRGMSYPYYEICIGESCLVVQCNVYELDSVIQDLLSKQQGFKKGFK
jgi:hypothetical protein